jgi:hypothetical protein
MRSLPEDEQEDEEGNLHEKIEKYTQGTGIQHKQSFA